MWSDRFTDKTAIFKIFDLLRQSNRALFSTEIAELLPGILNGTISACLSELLRRSLIAEGARIKVPTGGYGNLYGINDAVIQKRLRRLEEDKIENPARYVRGMLKRSIVEFLEIEKTGFTPAEIKAELGTGSTQHVVMNMCNRLANSGVIKKSPFSIPNRIPGKTWNMSNVYGIDTASVLKGIARLMPKAVREALIRIQNSSAVWPCWRLAEITKVSNENLKKWFKQGLCYMGLVKYVTAGNVTYYYNPRLPEDVVERQVAELKEQSRQWRLGITKLGRLFQRKALFTYVEYLKKKGYEIKTSESYPNYAPSWLSQKMRKKYQVIKEDENGNVWTEYANNVWAFDKDPFDYVIFVTDEKTKREKVHVLSCKRDVCKRYGVNYYTTFIGCVLMGRSKKGFNLPKFLSAEPVFICGETYGKAIRDFNKHEYGEVGTILTMKELAEMTKDAGKAFPLEKEFQELLEKKKAYDLYSNHEKVLLGEKTVFEIMKERGFKVD